MKYLLWNDLKHCFEKMIERNRVILANYKMIKKLPINKAKIMTYDYEAFPLSIMEANGDKHIEWMLSNYIQLNAHNDIIKNKEVFLAFYDDLGLKSPFLKVQHMFWSLITKYDIDIVKFFKENINLGYYLYLKIDEFYIKNRWAFNRYHYIHDNLIIGYDVGNFIILGYDDKGKFTENTVSFDKICKSFYSKDVCRDEGGWADDIYFIKYKYGDYLFNSELVKLSLSDYLNSTNTIEKYKRFSNPYSDTVFGLQVYDKVLEYLDCIKNTDIKFRGGENIDNRIFRIIMEHKGIMQERISYMQKKIGGLNDICNEYEKVNALSRKIHFMAIKYKIKENKAIIDNLMQSIKKIREMDYIILSKLIERM